MSAAEIGRWTGSHDDGTGQDIAAREVPLPPERWPYGPPDAHQSCCLLYEGGRYCDCAASAADDLEWGIPSRGYAANAVK